MRLHTNRSITASVSCVRAKRKILCLEKLQQPNVLYYFCFIAFRLNCCCTLAQSPLAGCFLEKLLQFCWVFFVVFFKAKYKKCSKWNKMKIRYEHLFLLFLLFVSVSRIAHHKDQLAFFKNGFIMEDSIEFKLCFNLFFLNVLIHWCFTRPPVNHSTHSVKSLPGNNPSPLVK